MVKFGPAGSDDEMILNKISAEKIPSYLTAKGLNAFEYPFTRGVNISSEKANILKDLFYKSNISLSVHAPYFINFAQCDEMKIESTFAYLMDSIVRGKEMGADRIVFHPGSLTKQTREVAFDNTIKNLKAFVEILNGKGINDFYICPETMGKHGQIGTVEEVFKMCEIDDRIIPTLDFGHINAYSLGGLDSNEKFEDILNLFVNKLGKKEIHIHFSKIEFGQKGELKHMTFENDGGFGPDYKMMLDSLKKFDANFRVICESRGTQIKDSITMKKYYKNGFNS